MHPQVKPFISDLAKKQSTYSEEELQAAARVVLGNDRVADGTLHLTVAEMFGVRLTDADVLELGEALLPDIARIAASDRPARAT